MGLVSKHIPNSVTKFCVHVFSWGGTSKGGHVKTNRLDGGVCSHLACSQQNALFIGIIFRFLCGGGVGHLEQQFNINSVLKKFFSKFY
jgi:hypothetical protein